MIQWLVYKICKALRVLHKLQAKYLFPYHTFYVCVVCGELFPDADSNCYYPGAHCGEWVHLKNTLEDWPTWKLRTVAMVDCAIQSITKIINIPLFAMYDCLRQISKPGVRFPDVYMFIIGSGMGRFWFNSAYRNYYLYRKHNTNPGELWRYIYA